MSATVELLDGGNAEVSQALLKCVQFATREHVFFLAPGTAGHSETILAGSPIVRPQAIPHGEQSGLVFHDLHGSRALPASSRATWLMLAATIGPEVHAPARANFCSGLQELSNASSRQLTFLGQPQVFEHRQNRQRQRHRRDSNSYTAPRQIESRTFARDRGFFLHKAAKFVRPPVSKCQRWRCLPWVKSLLIADDHEVIRHILCLIFAAQADFEVCGEAENGQQAIEMAQILHPDLIMLDLSMPIMNGIEAACALKRLMPMTPIIVFSDYSDVFSKAKLVKRELLHSCRRLRVFEC